VLSAERPWLTASFHWNPTYADDATLRRLRTEGELLATWPPAPFERTPTYCFAVASEYWIWQPDVGGIRFTAASPELCLFPVPDIDRSWFERLVSRSWLPAIYHVWHRQVLHASAVATDAGDVIAFTGSSGAGKSTIAYGLARRRRWSLVADDTLAFSTSVTCGSSAITLYPLRSEARLREETARHYGFPQATEQPFGWPGRPLRLRAIYALDGQAFPTSPIACARLRTAESYPLLLGQAHAFTLKRADFNQRMMREYLVLASAVPTFRAIYPKTLERLEAVLDCLELHSGERCATADTSGVDLTIGHEPDVARAPGSR
jgi:hypothetical protein